MTNYLTIQVLEPHVINSILYRSKIEIFHQIFIENKLKNLFLTKCCSVFLS